MAKKKIDKNSFEELLDELEAVVASLENGELDLEEAMASFKKGVDLSKECHARLDDADRKVKLLRKQASGAIVEEDFPETEES